MDAAIASMRNPERRLDGAASAGVSPISLHSVAELLGASSNASSDLSTNRLRAPKPSTTWLKMNAANAQHGMKILPSLRSSHQPEPKVKYAPAQILAAPRIAG